MALASLKMSRGLVATGVGGVCCKHGLWRPTSMVDLQKGERCEALNAYATQLC
jgi:hypothetical protein